MLGCIRCTTFSASRQFRHFLMSAQSGFTRSHNALANKISSDCTSFYIEGLMHSVFAKNFNLSQVKDSGTQIHSLHYFVAENIACLNTFVGSVRYLFTLLRYTIPYYSVELYPALIHCCGILYLNTMQGYIQFEKNTEVNPISLVIPKFNALMSYTKP